MKRISVGKSGAYALVDDEDYKDLTQYSWYLTGNENEDLYAVTYVYGVNTRKKVYMHRLIMNTPRGMDTDHKNQDGLDNRRRNLRVCTRAENMRNMKMRKTNTSGHKGIHWHKSNKRWVARLRVNKVEIQIGSFADKEEAIRAYIKGANKYHGEFARLH